MAKWGRNEDSIVRQVGRRKVLVIGMAGTLVFRVGCGWIEDTAVLVVAACQFELSRRHFTIANERQGRCHSFSSCEEAISLRDYLSVFQIISATVRLAGMKGRTCSA